MTNAETIECILDELSRGDRDAAERTVARECPHEPRRERRKSFAPAAALPIFMRDGFIDRYSGRRLLFPGALRIISLELPDAFPYQPHWKTDETHRAYWELHPTVDHVLPVARGGTNDEANLVTTSQLRNSAKANWTLEGLGWSLHPPGDMGLWDGLLEQSIGYVRNHPEALKDSLLRKWYDAVRKM